jgi:hypothetical protein
MADLPAVDDDQRRRDLILAKRQMAMEVASYVGAAVALFGAGLALGWGWPAMVVGILLYLNSHKLKG